MRLHGLIAAALAAMAWTAAAQAEPATAKVVLHAPLRILDPVLTNAYITRNHGYLIYDTPVSYTHLTLPTILLV